MRLLDRYIGGVVLGGTLLGLLLIVALDSFFVLINEAADVGEGRYTLTLAMQYMLLGIPARVHEFFPMAALIGSLMGLGSLAAGSELVAMRAAGMSIGRVVRSVIQAGLMMLLVVQGIGEFLAPPAQQAAESLRAYARNGRITFQGRHGYWARDGQRIIRVRQMAGDGVLGGIATYELRDDLSLAAVTEARRAERGDGFWSLKGVQETLFTDSGVEVRRKKNVRWDDSSALDVLDVVILDPQQMSTLALASYIDYLQRNGLESDPYRFAFWSRISGPFAALVMLFLAVPFVFGLLRSAGAGQRLFMGVMLGLAFQLLTQVLGHLGQVYGLNPVVSAFAPATLFLGLGLLVLRRL